MLEWGWKQGTLMHSEEIGCEVSLPPCSSSEAGLLIVVCVAASWDPRQALLLQQCSSVWLWQVAIVVQAGILTVPVLYQTHLGSFLRCSFFLFSVGHCFGISALVRDQSLGNSKTYFLCKVFCGTLWIYYSAVCSNCSVYAWTIHYGFN